MTTERRLQIATAITTISEVYERELSPAAVAIYVTTLQRFEPQLIIKALQRHVEDPERGRFMPRPADIIVHLRPDGSATAFNAWTDVLNVIHHNKSAGEHDQRPAGASDRPRNGRMVGFEVWSRRPIATPIRAVRETLPANVKVPNTDDYATTCNT